MYNKKIMSEIDTQDVDFVNNEGSVSEEDNEETPKSPTPEEDEKEEDSVDYKAKYFQLQRHYNKKQTATPAVKAETVTKSTEELVKELAKEREISNFAEDNDISVSQARQVYKVNSSPTKETLNDPFIKAGLDAMARKSRLEANTPSAAKVSTYAGKAFKDLPLSEKNKHFADHLKNISKK